MLKELKEELERAVALYGATEFHPRNWRGNGQIEIRGHRLTDFTSWDFFNLHSEPRVKRAVQTEVELNGVGAGASRLSSGTSALHIACELRLAQFVGQEAAVLFSSTNQAVLSLVAALISERDCVIVDDSIQSPVVDASFLVHADVLDFRGDDPDSLLHILDHTKPYRRKFLFLRTVGPLFGQVLNLPVLVEYASKKGVQILLDEGYGIGLLGLRGAGSAEKFNIIRPLCIYGSLSKALGCYGAFVAAPKVLINYLINRSQIFRSENVLPPCFAAAIEAAIEVIEVQPGTRERLRSLARKLRRGMKEQGLAVDADLDTPIIGVHFETRTTAQEFANALFAKGYLVEVITAGLMRSDQVVVRILVNSSHKETEIDSFLAAINAIRGRIE